MKIMKRLAAFALTLCLALPMYSMVSYAAGGRVSFTDPKTKTGETVEVTCALRAEQGGLESFDITLKYDPEYLAFESGDTGVQKTSDGVIKYSGTSDGEERIGFNMKFVALKMGTTKIEVTESKGVSEDGGELTLRDGNSTVEIAQGTSEVVAPVTSSSDVQVTVDGVTYNLSDNFKNSDIPAGFTEVTISYEGTERRFIQDQNGGATLGYLVNAEGKGDFFLYNPADSTFAAYVMVTVSPSTSIVLQKAEEGLEIPEGYQEVKLTVNDNEFPAWQSVDKEGFYLVYAMNNNTGEKGFYQYDTVEESYQRYVEAEADTEPETAPVSTNKYVKLIEDNLMLVLIAIGAILFLLLIFIIVLSVKLGHRNSELDDLYENGVDALDKTDEIPVRGNVKKAEKKGGIKKKSDDQDDLDDDFRTISIDDDEDLYDDSYEDDYEDDSYEDDSYDDEYEDDYDDELYEDDYDDEYEDDLDDDYNDEYDDDEFDFNDDDEDYDVDFIDLE